MLAAAAPAHLQQAAGRVGSFSAVCSLACLPVAWLLPAPPLRPAPCTLQVILRPDGSWPWPGGSLSSKAVETEVRQEAAGILGR